MPPGRKGILKPDATTLCVKCNQRSPVPGGTGVCSTCLIYEARGVKVPNEPLRPGHTPPPPRAPGYAKNPPQPTPVEAAPPDAPDDKKPG